MSRPWQLWATSGLPLGLRDPPPGEGMARQARPVPPRGPPFPRLHQERFGPGSPPALPWPGNQAPLRADTLATGTFWLSASSPNYSRLSVYEMFIFLTSGG